jgi:hypothetical protein
VLLVVLSKVDGGSALRTEEVRGSAESGPRVGCRFTMTAEPLNPEAFLRVVTTSEVKSWDYDADEKHIVFRTENSTYRLTILDEV